MYNIGV